MQGFATESKQKTTLSIHIYHTITIQNQRDHEKFPQNAEDRSCDTLSLTTILKDIK